MHAPPSFPIDIAALLNGGLRANYQRACVLLAQCFIAAQGGPSEAPTAGILSFFRSYEMPEGRSVAWFLEHDPQAALAFLAGEVAEIEAKLEKMGHAVLEREMPKPSGVKPPDGGASTPDS